MNGDHDLVGYAVDRFGDASHSTVLEELVRGMDRGVLRESIGEYGLEAVAESYLRTLVRERTLFADAGDAHYEAERLQHTDPDASPRVHTVSVADLADLFTRLGLTDPP